MKFSKKRYPSENCKPCTPIDPTCIQGPPECEGVECDEVYSMECIIYTGQNLDCLGITYGMSLMEILQVLEDNCETTTPVYGNCIHPIDELLEYAIELHRISSVGDDGSPITLVNIVNDLLIDGMLYVNCGFCPPDCNPYLLGNSDDIETILTVLGRTCCSNCTTNLQECLDNLDAVAPGASSIFEEEYGSILGLSTICRIVTMLTSAGYDSTTIYPLFQLLMNDGISIYQIEPGISISHFDVLITNLTP